MPKINPASSFRVAVPNAQCQPLSGMVDLRFQPRAGGEPIILKNQDAPGPEAVTAAAAQRLADPIPSAAGASAVRPTPVHELRGTPVSEQFAMAAEAEGRAAQGGARLSGILFGVGAAISGGCQTFDRRKAPALQPQTSRVSLVCRLTSLPGALKFLMAYANGVFNLMALIGGCGYGVQSLAGHDYRPERLRPSLFFEPLQLACELTKEWRADATRSPKGGFHA